MLREINPEEAKASDRAEVSGETVSIQGNTQDDGSGDDTTDLVVIISAPKAKTMFGDTSLGRTSLSGLEDTLLQAIMGNLGDKIKDRPVSRHIVVVLININNNGQGFDSAGISIKKY